MTPPAAPRLLQPVEIVVRPEIWLTFEEVAQLVSYEDGAGAISKREVQIRVKEGRYIARETEERAANGHAVRKIALSSLPEDAQARWIARQSNSELAVAITPKDEPLPPMSVRLRGNAIPLTADGAADFAALRAAGRNTEAEIGERRLQIVCECLSQIPPRGQGRSLIYEQVAGRFNESPRTIRRWVQLYRRGRSPALVPGFGHNRGVYPSIPDGLQRAILAVYRQQQRQTVSQIMAHTVRPWCKRHDDCETPNRTTVARFLANEVDRAECIAFREGPRAAEARVMPKCHRDLASMRPSQVFCGDHRILDIFVMRPDRQSWFRPWVTFFFDEGTGSLAGWCAAEGPSALTVALALRAAILKRGVPEALRVDNGKEFVCKAMGGKAFGAASARRRTLEYPTADEIGQRTSWPAAIPEYLQGGRTTALFAQLGIGHVYHATPLHAWAKPCESFLRAFHVRWENMTPGYCGNNPAHRPEKLARELKQHMLLEWSRFLQIFAQHVAEWDARPHGERGLSPDQLYNRAGDQVRRASESALDLLMLKSSGDRPPVVQTKGISIQGRHYLSAELYAYALQKVHVWWDPCNPSHIVCRPVINPNLRIVVPEIGHADCNGFGAINEKIASIRKSKSQGFKLIAASDRAALQVEQVDPHGANLMAAQNAADFRVEQAAEKTPEALTDAAAIKAAQRTDNQAETAVQTAHEEAAAEASHSIFERAKRELARRNGELPQEGA